MNDFEKQTAQDLFQWLFFILRIISWNNQRSLNWTFYSPVLHENLHGISESIQIIVEDRPSDNVDSIVTISPFGKIVIKISTPNLLNLI